MSWLRLEVNVGRDTRAELEAALAPFKPLSVSYADAREHPILEPEPGETPLWPEIRACVLLDPAIRREEVMLALISRLPRVRAAEIHWSRLEDEDWQNSWRDHFRAARFGTRLWICPDGELPSDQNAVVVKLSPGLAFGTGGHPTTALCLRWLDGWVYPDCAVLDYGCGSGVLGIAARRLGAGRVAAVDIDPQAREATRLNAIRNNVDRELEISRDSPGGTFDLVVANILAGTLIELAGQLVDRCQLGGRMALSGILDEQAADVRGAFADRVRFEEDMCMHGWKLLHGTRAH